MRELSESAAILIFGSIAFLFWVAHFNNYDRDIFSDSVYYRSARPFVYRTLLPTTVNVMTRLVPQPMRRAAVQFVLDNSTMRSVFTVSDPRNLPHGRLKLEQKFPVETAIGLTLMFFSFIGFLFVARRLFSCFYEGSSLFLGLIPGMAALGFLPWISYTSHPYDLTTLLLSSLFYYQVAKERWWTLVFVFFLACLNKETAILDIIVFATYSIFRQFPKRVVLSLLFAQSAIFLFIKAALVYTFRNNPGNVLEFHLFDVNAELFSRWLQQGVSASVLVTGTVIVVAISYQWNRKPILFRSGLAAIPPLACLGLFFGVFDEWRQYTDAYTPLLMLCLGSLGALFGVRRIVNSTPATLR